MKRNQYDEKLMELLDLSLRREAQVIAALDAARDVLDRITHDQSHCPDILDSSM